MADDAPKTPGSGPVATAAAAVLELLRLIPPKHQAHAEQTIGAMQIAHCQQQQSAYALGYDEGRTAQEALENVALATAYTELVALRAAVLKQHGELAPDAPASLLTH